MLCHLKVGRLEHQWKWGHAMLVKGVSLNEARYGRFDNYVGILSALFLWVLFYVMIPRTNILKDLKSL